jgi:7,8-dihydropterin-6-yl-methyl-4-(beta-D-ribofuranosyl)aminobenzene 5'-phosphate synthase
MKATILVDNIGTKDLKGEWGLSIFIEANDKKILLDTGGSSLFLENAKKLNIDISTVDYAVLSHAHYDHADGMETFFRNNVKAKFYMRKQADENCYLKKWFLHKYIGIPKNIMQNFEGRIERVDGNYKLGDNIYLCPHYTDNLELIGKKNNMYVKCDHKWYPDDFAHEQSLVFDTDEGLAIFNCCSHGGADNIIHEVSKQFHKPVKMMVGGFHLYTQKADEVVALSKRLQQSGVKEIYTGHCTGQKSFGVMKEELGDMVKQLKVGLTIEF